jgi:hypothetical protein
MSHYTMQSGKETVTRSLYCPACHRRHVLMQAQSQELAGGHLFVPSQVLYCTEECRNIHTTRVALDVARYVPIFSQRHSEDLQVILNGVLPDWVGQLLAMKGPPP